MTIPPSDFDLVCCRLAIAEAVSAETMLIGRTRKINTS